MKIFFFLFCFIYLNIANAQQTYLIVGTYDSPKSDGIYVFSFDEENGTTKEVSHIKISNPSYLTVSKDNRFVYAVSENAKKDGKGGKLMSFSFDQATGKLTLINEQESGGDHPCHVSLDHTGKWLFVSNYTGGSFSRFAINDNGAMGEGVTIKHNGSGPNKERQASAHVHGAFISNDNKVLHVTDLGMDKLMSYDFDSENGNINTSEPSNFSTVAGAGPRVLLQNNNRPFAYMIEELSGTIQVFKQYKNARLKPIQRISTMQKGDTQFAGSADLQLSSDSKFLYASNRADVNNIAIYKVRRNGKLKSIAHQSTLGKTPRNFIIDPSGKFMLVANQNSNEIVVFKRGKASGLLTDSGNRIKLGKPVCLKWIMIKK